MVSQQELQWFKDYSNVFEGNPRKMKRIINSYMVSRYVAQRLKVNQNRGNDLFYKKLLKLIILFEQWPCRMAWILAVVKNLQREIKLSNLEGRFPIGNSLSSIAEKMLKDKLRYSLICQIIIL